jgi:hypothetical protein
MMLHSRHTLAVVLGTLVAGLAMTGPAAAQTAGPQIRAEVKVYTATVTDVDPSLRLVTMRGADGQTSVVEAPPTMAPGELAGIRPGDVVTVTYYKGLAIRRKPAGEPPTDTGADPLTGIRTATVTISDVDATGGTLTFIGPRGRYERSALEGFDPAMLQAARAGEVADVTYVEYVQSLARTGAAAVPDTGVPPPPPVSVGQPFSDSDSLRHRLTVSVLVGWDNQFSGKVIDAASGATTNGQPINLDETSFDDVYGRMGMFKVGVGYRTSPRVEAVVNFVLSRSAAEPVQVGTWTTANLPVTVQFDNYSYWGFEGGQRFFFVKPRFTPFVGYLVGVNRLSSIRGLFLDVPLDLLPGYVAQDGKIFDSSWAISAGPTGGVLIGVGPFEFLAETQLRYIGGLSDVDWLVEEGLRDINKKSSRWSFPILVGVRLRF